MKKYLLIVLILASINAMSQNTFPASGNVGIGTTTPAHKLDIAGDLHTTSTISESLDNANIYVNNTAGTFVGGFGTATWQGGVNTDLAIVANKNLFTYTNNSLTPSMTILTSGNVGIGTTAPNAPLHIQPNNGVSSDAQMAIFGNSTGHPYVTVGSGSNAGGYIIWNQSGNSELGLGTHGTTATLNIKSGNVGIGTTSPNYGLDVAANTGINVRGAGESIMTFTAPSAGGGHTYQVGTSWSGGYVPAGFYISDNSSIQMAIVGGNVGIGTTNPGSYKLAVEGKVGVRKLVVTQTNPWADYVFNDNYQLKPLTEVENYIKTNKHLPDVPSARQVEKDGIDVGDNQALLLKKIEELTLYMIQQQKQIEEVKNRNEKLEKEVLKLKSKNKK